MHEKSLMKSLIRQIEKLALEHQAKQVTAIKLRVGPLAHFSREHFQEHFSQASLSTMAEGARIDVELIPDIDDPHAQEIILTEVELS